MTLYKISDKIVFNILSDIKIGYLEITNYQGKVFNVGNPQDNLKAKLRIINSNFSFNLIKGGSIGFAESYMRGEFETDNLSNLIEITARNIQIIYKFSGLLDLPIINFFKNIIIKNTKIQSFYKFPLMKFMEVLTEVNLLKTVLLNLIHHTVPVKPQQIFW